MPTPASISATINQGGDLSTEAVQALLAAGHGGGTSQYDSEAVALVSGGGTAQHSQYGARALARFCSSGGQLRGHVTLVDLGVPAHTRPAPALPEGFRCSGTPGGRETLLLGSDGRLVAFKNSVNMQGSAEGRVSNKVGTWEQADPGCLVWCALRDSLHRLCSQARPAAASPGGANQRGGACP